MPTPRFAFAATLLCTAACTTAAAFDPPRYTVHRLQTRGNFASIEAGPINDEGAVVGVACSARGVARRSGAVWPTTPTMRLLPVNIRDESFGGASINRGGDIAGCISEYDGACLTAAVYRVDGLHGLASVLPQGLYSEAAGLNDAGQVVGNSFDSEGPVLRAWMWSPGAGRIDIPPYNAFHKMTASRINDAGLVVGYFPVSPSTGYHVFTWTPQAGVRDIGALAQGDTLPGGVNNRGQVAMFGYPTVTSYVYDTQRDVLTTLPLLDGYPNAGLSDINDDSVVVGSSGCAHGGANGLCAAAWYPTPQGYEVRDLNTLIDWPAGREPVIVYGASGLNNRGQIVVLAPNEVWQTFVLTPE